MNANSVQDDMEEADLGLGDGLKPGALPISTSQACKQNFDELFSKVDEHSDESCNFGHDCSDDNSDEEFELTLMPIRQIQSLKSQYAKLLPRSSRSSEVSSGNCDDNVIYDERYFTGKKMSPKCQGNCPQESGCDICCEDVCQSKFPSYADVQYGTSIRQQKELFNQQIEELRKKMNVTVATPQTSGEDFKGQQYKSRKKRSCGEIAMKLAETMQEVEDVKAELEACEQKLDSKYKAINILRKQAEEAQSQLKFTEKISKEASLKLSQVNISGGGTDRVTSLVMEPNQDLGDVSTQLLPRRPADSKKTDVKPKTVSMEKYKSICQDNMSLTKSLEARTEELRKITAHKMAIKRENDELLALLDVQERAKYEKTRSVSSEENYYSYSSTELAVLGACRCRISSPEPCGCAHAAANLKKDIMKLKEELLLYKARRDEAFHTVDAYRKAFEEQLQRNKALTLQLANISSGRNSNGGIPTSSKAKLALKWLIGTLNDEEIPDDESSMTPGPGMSEYELITYLTEMLNEKREVLAHQKLASQILGDKVKVLEEKLLHYEKEDSDVFQ